MSIKFQLSKPLNDDNILCVYLYYIGGRDGKMKKKTNKSVTEKSTGEKRKMDK